MHMTVRHLPASVTTQNLRELFAPYGAIGIIYIITKYTNDRSQGCGSVAMPDRHAAQAAIAGLHGTTHAGRALTVHEAQPGTPRSGSSQSW